MAWYDDLHFILRWSRYLVLCSMFFRIVWSKNILKEIVSCWWILKYIKTCWNVVQEHGKVQHGGI